VNASRFPVSVGGHKVYGAYFEGGMGYRIDITKGVARGNDPETLYMVTSGTHVNTGCCFDYGNAESNNKDTGKGSMEAVYFGLARGSCRAAGAGPWVQVSTLRSWAVDSGEHSSARHF
jgi:non-reducing end alpha-L-arabinofuranosidase